MRYLEAYERMLREEEERKKRGQEKVAADAKAVAARQAAREAAKKQQTQKAATVQEQSRGKSSPDILGLDLFQKGAFEDGYQFGDVTKAILGTGGDVGLNVLKGAGGLVEGLTDLAGYGAAGLADLLGFDAQAQKLRQSAQKDTIGEWTQGASDFLDRYSVLGTTADAAAQGIGQVGAIILSGGAAGLTGAGATALSTGLLGLSGVGSGMSEAYEGGATDEEAALYGVISGVADAATELIFAGWGKAAKAAGLGKGLSKLDDITAKALTDKIQNLTVKNLTEYAVKSGFEGLEEVGAGAIQALGKKLTYMSEEDFGKIMRDEKLFEQFFVGSLVSGTLQGGQVIDTTARGRDFVTGLSKNEEAVVNAEVKKRIADAQKDGSTLTKKEQNAIREKVEADMDKGYLSTDTIEEVLGGEDYKAYLEAQEKEAAVLKKLEDLYEGEELEAQKQKLLQDSALPGMLADLSARVAELSKTERFGESYREAERTKQLFTADLSKYTDNQKRIVQKAMDSGVLNNTNRSHELVDLVAKIGARVGVDFDFTNNQKLKESGFALEGVTVNGYVGKNGITVNVNSQKALNTVVGHEIAHVLEGSNLYEPLSTLITDYAKGKGEYDTRLKQLISTYQNVEGYKGAEGYSAIEKELVADLVGDYLFTDQDFVNRLSTENRSVFTKIFDEIKHLYKLATAGTKEARQLEEVKKMFEDVVSGKGKSTVSDEQNAKGLNREQEVTFSLSKNSEYMEKAIIDNEKTKAVDPDAMKTAQEVRGRIADRMNEIYDKGLVALPEDVEGNTAIANSSYDVTEENTTICPRSLAAEAFVDAVSEYLGRPLTVDEQIYISQDLQGRSLTPECTYCYVATDRKAYRAFLGQYIQQRDSVIDKLKGSENADTSRSGQIYQDFLNGRKDTDQMYGRFKLWVDAYKSGKPMIEASHLANMNKLMGDINSEFGAELKPQIVDAMKYAQSASWAKKRINYVAYNGHILKWKQDRINKLNSHYGLRMYSFSDFHPAFVLENMQMITDASVRGLKMLGYTKDTDFVEIFAPSGMNINVSTFGFEAGGNVYENNVIGAAWDKAKALRSQYPNVGVTFVATNDTLVDWALNQDWIDVVIPYHLVRTGAEVAKAFDYTNYTGESSDVKDADWEKSRDQKYIAPTEHNNDKATYLEALQNNHLRPRFSKYIDHPNYMKLVNECRQSASNSTPVQPVFNEEAAMAALNKLEANGYYQPVGGSVDRMYEIAAEVAERMPEDLRGTDRESGWAKRLPTYSLSEDSDIPIRDTSRWEIRGEDVEAMDIPIREDLIREDLNTDTAADEGVTSRLPDRDITMRVREGIAEKIEHAQTELDNNRSLRQEYLSDYNARIAKAQEILNGKKRLDTKVASDLRQRIERLTRIRDDVVSGYDKRIADLEKKLENLHSEEFARAEYRRAKQDEYYNLWKNPLGDTSTWKDLPLGLQYKTQTMRRFLRKIVRDANGKPDIKKADRIYEELETRYDQHEAELKKESKRLKEVFFELNLTKYEDVYAHMLGEFRHNPESKVREEDLQAYYEKHKKHIDQTKVDKAISEARALYEELFPRINDALREEGMREIPYRKGYFPHFRLPKQSIIGKFFGWKAIDNEIPTDIAGLTEAFKPGKSWQSFDKERKGDPTDYSLYQGLDTYIHGALDWIYHVSDLQKRRALENYIRYIHSEDGVKERIAEISTKNYDAVEAQKLISGVLAEANNPLGGFVREMMNRTNTLANKKSSMDRSLEDATNRKVYSVMTNLNNRVNANMVVGSLSSALTNFIPMVQSWHQVSPKYTVRALGDTIRSAIRDDGVVGESDFLTNRLMPEENLKKTVWDKASEKAGWMMEVIDSITSQTVWRSKYLQNLNEGMSEAQAVKDADQFSKNLMAGRSRGNMPSIFDAKNPLVKIATAFQLEVANQYGYMFEDLPKDSPNWKRLVKGYATAFVGAYLYNALYSTLTGRNAAFDPIRIIQELIGGLGDDEEEPEEVILDFAEDVMDEVPYIGGLMGGGRIPISSALPYGGDQSPFESMVNDVSAGDWESFGKELLNPLYYLISPFGGGQAKKTVEGLSMFDDDLPIAGSYTDSGKLRFPVEDTIPNRIQAGLFGQWASQNARDYFDNNRTPLSAEQTQELIDLDLPIADYWKYREGLKGKDTLAEQADYIAGLDLPTAQKNILINNRTDRKEEIDLTDYGQYGSFEEMDFATKYPEKYKVAQTVGGYETYMGFREDMKEMKIDQKVDYVASLPLSIEQKNALINSETDRKEPIDLTGYENFGSFEEFEFAKANPDSYAMSKAVGGYDAYKVYSEAINAIRADKDEYGQSISGSRKQKVLSYISDLDADEITKLILFKSEYTSYDDDNQLIAEYIVGLDGLTTDEKRNVLLKLGFKVTKEGKVSW